MADAKHLKVVRKGSKAIKAFRERNPDVRFDLRGANLLGPDLYLDLSFADLHGADLSDADLRDTILFDANLSSADLSRADLNGANLNGANLRDTILFKARLRSADLSRADLNGANFDSSMLAFTTIGNVDLSQAKGLEQVRHHGPSTIGVDTLFRSNGKIPEVFLRGCGVPEDLITYLSSFVGKAFDFYSCFISYNHEDKQFARQLHDRLQGKGIRCWLDEKDLNAGEDLHDGIERGIRVWDKVLLCASRDSLNSWWVNKEIKIAIGQEQKLFETTKRKVLKLIPLNLDGFMHSNEWESGYRQDIQDRVAPDFTKWKTDADEFERQFERVVKALRTDGGKLPEPESKLK